MSTPKKVAHYMCAKSFLKKGKFVFDLLFLKQKQINTIFDLGEMEMQIRSCGYVLNHIGNFNFEVIKK